MTDIENCTKKNIAGFHFDSVTYEDVFESILSWQQNRQSRLISLVNPYSVLLGQWDPKMSRAIKASSLVLADGVGITHACRILGYTPLRRVTGPALMLEICDWSRLSGLRHYFYGGSQTVVERLVRNLTEKFPGLQVAGRESPPFRPLSKSEDNNAIERINTAKADIVWVGLGAPKQEKWMLDHLGKIESAALIGVGAAFDFHAGTKPWAPAWMRHCGIEWMHRFWSEPKRMWRRNLVNLLFLNKVLTQSIKINLLRQSDNTEPPHPLYYSFQPKIQTQENSNGHFMPLPN